MSKNVVLERFPAYETRRYIWRFQDIPKNDRIRNSAIFVVHGIGTQSYYDTAVQWRANAEDIIHQLQPNGNGRRVPPPFTTEGYWANYSSLRHTFPEEWTEFNKRERHFFGRLWEERSFSKTRNYFWWIGQAFRFPWTHRRGVQRVNDRLEQRSLGVFSFLLALVETLFVVPLTLLSFTFLFLRHPKILMHVLADVRIYVEPRGEIEHAIVQKIEHRVGRDFLRLLGLDWDLEDLEDGDLLPIGDRGHKFTHVTWIAHSLGTVISYNVIGDILRRCDEFRAKGLRIRNVEKVERGLHRFYTIGSPLDKFATLFRHVLRPWPEKEALRVARGERPDRKWWVNFHHVGDPVSGALNNPALLQSDDHGPIVTNYHSKVVRLPGFAHLSYWRDRDIQTHILTRTYDRTTLPHLKDGGTKPFPHRGLASQALYAAVCLVVIVGAAVAAVRWDWVRELVLKALVGF